jgi:LytS/YehU family sensor histidine kinase
MRFQDRLEVAIDVNDGLDDVLVPALVLQPLVENAIRHGVEACVGLTRIAVAARRETDSLVLEVIDSGDAAEPRAGNGVGLAATRERLAHIYGPAARLDLAVAPDRSTAMIAVPLQRGVA